MKTKAVSKYNRISARKARIVADMVRGQKATNAFDILKFTPQKAAKLIEKTLKSAVSNAENNQGINKDDLVISEIMIDEGPTLKRYRPRSKGMANAIMKRTSHVTIVLEKSNRKKNKKESGKKSENKKFGNRLTKKSSSAHKTKNERSEDDNGS